MARGQRALNFFGSSLVKRLGTDNLTGLKRSTEAVNSGGLRISGLVGEHSDQFEARPKGRVDGSEETLPA